MPPVWIMLPDGSNISSDEQNTNALFAGGRLSASATSSRSCMNQGR
jgi:hypothetical protein